MSGFTTPSQAWAILNRHARDEIAPLRLKELCTDNDRVRALVAAHNGSETATKRIINAAQKSNSGQTPTGSNRLLIADLSRQRMTLETLNHLLRLATAVDVRGFIRTLAWGQNDRHNPMDKTDANADKNEDYQRPKSHFSFEQDDSRTNVTLSPSRSVISTMKKTRFADSNDYPDDQTVASAAHNHPPHPPVHKMTLKTSPSMHMALRAPAHGNLQMFTSDGSNALDEIHGEWKRIQNISSSIRKGQMRGATGHMLQNVLVVGRGTACSACEFVYNALKYDEDGSAGLRHGISDRKSSSPLGRSIRFLSTVDPVALHSALSDWNPEQTLIISVVLNGDEADIIHLTDVIKKWMFQGNKAHAKRPDVIWGKHVLFVTGSEILHRTQSVTKPDCSFLISQGARSAAFTSMTVAGLLPLSIAFGWNVVQEMLNGAHDLDSHFVETNPRHNLPVLLALVDLWNDHFLPSVSKESSCGGRIISPFMESFASYPAFVAMVEAQVCGRIPTGRTRDLHDRVAPSGTVIDGGLCGSFDRVLYQGGRSPPSELIIAMDSQVPHSQEGVDDYSRLLFGMNENGDLSNQDHLMCSFFAHADVMALGSLSSRSRGDGGRSVASGYTATPTFTGLGSTSFDSNFPVLNAENDLAEGNHPSTLLLCSRCDAFACGQLIALAEHRAMITARLWDIENPFAFAQSHGSILRSKQEELMKEKLDSVYQRLDLVGNLEDDDEADNVGGPKLSYAVKQLLGHYATSMNEKRKGFR